LFFALYQKNRETKMGRGGQGIMVEAINLGLTRRKQGRGLLVWQGCSCNQRTNAWETPLS
jgi:hypothetical protein